MIRISYHIKNIVCFFLFSMYSYCSESYRWMLSDKDIATLIVAETHFYKDDLPEPPLGLHQVGVRNKNSM